MALTGSDNLFDIREVLLDSSGPVIWVKIIDAKPGGSIEVFRESVSNFVADIFRSEVASEGDNGVEVSDSGSFGGSVMLEEIWADLSFCSPDFEDGQTDVFCVKATE